MCRVRCVGEQRTRVVNELTTVALYLCEGLL
jgi:hypothetical protein